MFKRRWPVLLGPPLVAIAVLIALTRTDLAAIAGRVIAVPNLAACPSAAMVATGHPSPGTWWKTTDALDANGSIVGRQLFIGHGPRAAAQLDLPIESSVSGPIDGIVVVTSDDGTRSRVQLVSVAAKCAVVVDERDDVVRSAVLDPMDGSVFAHVVGRATRTDLGTFRITPASQGGTEARLVAPPLGNLSSEVGTVWATVLRLDAAGTHLAVQSCADFTCLTRVFDITAAGAAPRIVKGPDQGPLLGFAGADLVTWQACVAYPCPVLAWDVATGHTRTLVTGARAAALTANGRRLVALGVGSAVEVDTATGRTTGLLGIPVGNRPIGGGPASTLGLEVGADEVGMATPGGDPLALRPDSAAEEALP